MDAKSLYDLPKDMLIKLIMTIEKDAIERYKKEINSKALDANTCCRCELVYSTEYDWEFFRSRFYCQECFKQLALRNVP